MTSLHSLVTTSAQVAAMSSRLGKIRALVDLLASMQGSEARLAVLYLTGTLPQGRIGITTQALRTAASRPAAPESRLQLEEVDATLQAVADSRGAGSAARRLMLLEQMFQAATPEEQEFLIRLMAGELRQGALGGLMIEAIATAAGIQGASVRKAAMYAPDLGSLAVMALARGEEGLGQYTLQLFNPVAPMLAQTAADVDQALRELSSPVQFEWKMDGARIQVHKRGTDVRIYTRSLNTVGDAIPEVVAAAAALPAHEVVLDGEALAFTPSARPHPFQVTMRRFGRRLDVESLLAELPMRAFYFDCLLLEGRVLADRPLIERIAALDSVVPEDSRMPRLVTAHLPAASAFHEAAMAAGHEGVMAKAMDSHYEAGNRGASWFKVKRAHTLDLVVLAAEWGNGRRTGKLSNLHLGARDAGTGTFIMLGKTFKGLTDQMLEWQTRELLAREVRRDALTVFVRPELVVEVAFSDLQVSSRYPGGLALRLARVKRYRDDKQVQEADTMDSVRRIHAASG